MSLETGFEKSVYKNWSDYCKTILETNSVGSFKNHPNIEYMTEHHCLANFTSDWYRTIQRICLENFITDDILQELVQLNEKIGNSAKNTRVFNLECNANTIRYIYMAMLTYNNLKNEDQFHFVEIGGGYGGYAVVVNKLFERMGKTILSYKMVDIENVIELQKQYISSLISTNHFEWIVNTKVEEVKFEPSFLFSSYSLSEIDPSSRKYYYDTIFPNVVRGIVFWNSVEIDLPQTYQKTVQDETPKTGPYNKIVYFESKFLN